MIKLAGPSYSIVFTINQLADLEPQLKKMIGEFCEKLQRLKLGGNIDCEIALVSGQTPIDQVNWQFLPSADYSIPDDFITHTDYLSNNLKQAGKAIKGRLDLFREEGIKKEPYVVICSDSSINGYLEIFKHLDIYKLIGEVGLFIVIFDDEHGVSYYDVKSGTKGNTCELLIDRIIDDYFLKEYLLDSPAPPRSLTTIDTVDLM